MAIEKGFKPNRMTAEFVNAIKTLTTTGKGYSEIIDALGWNKTTMSLVMNGKRNVPVEVYERFTEVFKLENNQPEIIKSSLEKSIENLTITNQVNAKSIERLIEDKEASLRLVERLVTILERREGIDMPALELPSPGTPGTSRAKKIEEIKKPHK